MDVASAHAAVRQRLLAVEPPLRPGSHNKYDATIGTSLGQTVGAEDCLYLNIWRPATADTQLPVIVWVHGGSNISGYTADPVYDGADLARTANAVVVSVNYRLGVFGFLNLGAAEDRQMPLDDSGNFALLDIIKALQFVNRNIASFGGNPGNVTLMGQSAGAVNVYAVMTSPPLVAGQPSARPPAAADQRRHLAGQRAAARQHPDARAGIGVPRQADLAAESAAGRRRPGDRRGRGDGLRRDEAAGEIAAYLRSKSADAMLDDGA